MQVDDEFELGFENEYIRYENDIITASYYMTWDLVFNRDAVSQIQAYKPTEDIPLATYVCMLIRKLRC